MSDLAAARRKAEEVLAHAIRNLPAHDQGAYYYERFDQDGEYLGSEQVSPDSVVQMLHEAIEAALSLLAATAEPAPAVPEGAVSPEEFENEMNMLTHGAGSADRILGYYRAALAAPQEEKEESRG